MQSSPPSTSESVPPLDQLGAATPHWNAMAWLLAWYDRYRVVYFVVLGLFFAAGFTGRWQPEPDAALYLSIGRNLAQGEGYNYHGHPHALAYPGMPYLLAGTFAIFGIDVVWPAHALMLLMAGVGLALCYRLLRLHTNRPTAVLLTCMVGMTFTYYRYAFELRNDLPFAVGVLAFLAGWEACMAKPRAGEMDRRVRWYDIALMMGGLALAMVMRPHMWVLLAAIFGAGVIRMFKSQRARRILLPLLVALVAVVAVLRWMDPRSGAGVRYTYEAAFLASLRELATVEGFAGLAGRTWTLIDATLVEAAFGHLLGPVITPIVGVVLLVMSVALIRRRWLWGLFILGTVLMLVLVLPGPRYLLPVLPLMALAWFGGMSAVNRRLRHPWGNVAVILMLAMWVVPNFLKIIKLIGEQHVPSMAHSYDRYATLRDFSDDVRAAVEPEAWVLADEKIARVLSYWSDRRVAAPYEIEPLERIAQRLYVVQPAGDDVLAKMAYAGMVMDEVVGVEAGKDVDPPPWTLRRLVRREEAVTP